MGEHREMPRLYIYGDEAGVMPVEDAHLPFVAATVMFTRPPVSTAFEGRFPWLVRELQHQRGLPFVAYVRPFPGYGPRLKSKVTALQEAADRARAQRGQPRELLNIRNHVWEHAMLQAVIQAVVTFVALGPVEGIEILLDQKTLPRPARTRFLHVIQAVDERIAETLPELPKHVAVIVERRMRFSRRDVTVRWSDEDARLDASHGLRLADLLAGQAIQSLVGQARFDVAEGLARFPDPVKDVTRYLL